MNWDLLATKRSSLVYTLLQRQTAGFLVLHAAYEPADVLHFE